jgi:hypothetical protein
MRSQISLLRNSQCVKFDEEIVLQAEDLDVHILMFVTFKSAVFHFPAALSLADWKGTRRSQISPSFGSSRAISQLIVKLRVARAFVNSDSRERLSREQR